MKKYRWFSILLLVLLPLSLQLKAQVQPVEVKRTNEKTIINGKIYYIHTVQKGQTLYSISKAYEVSQEDIIRENPGVTAATLKEGQVLRIPLVKSSVAPAYPENKEDFYEHVVKKSQTIYSISKKYNVPEEVIYQYNPWAREGIQADQTLWIPKKKELKYETSAGQDNINFYYYTVKDKDTLYSLSKTYNVPVADIINANPDLRWGLKSGMIIKIPRQVNAPADTLSKADSIIFSSTPCEKADSGEVFNVALLLPFFADFNTEEMVNPDDTLTEEGTFTPEQRQMGLRGKSFLEFYEGFLLALDSLKSTGLSVNLHVFDTKRDTVGLKKILRELSIEQPDLIIGPVYSEEVKIAGRFARYEEINMVSPLSSRIQCDSGNTKIFQVVPSKNNESKDLAGYLSQYASENFILIRGTDSLSLKDSWRFKKHILEYLPKDTLGKPLHFADYRLTDTLMMNLSQKLNKDMDNIIIVFSESEPDVSRLISKLYLMSELYRMKIYGLPSWQVWKTIELNYVHGLQVNLFTPFFVDYSNEKIIRFLKKCREVYGYEPYEITPAGYNFCILGYDEGMYFLSALKLYGKDFQNCLDNINGNLLLTNYHFIKNANGNYENNAINLIQYKSDYTVVKTEQLINAVTP